MSQRLLSSVVAIVVVCTAALAFPASALATKYWQGNEREAYGVSADIRTPSTNPWVNVPGFVAAWATNYEWNGGTCNSAQCGWIKGDGQAMINGVLLPAVPTSYMEVSTPGGQGVFVLFSSQPLNYYRSYVVENVAGTTNWIVRIAGQQRGGVYTYNHAKLMTRACMEVDDPHIPVDNVCSAGFKNVKFKGITSWMNYDQSNFEAPFLPWIWTSIDQLYQYQTYCN